MKRILIVFAVTAVTLVSVFAGAEQYAEKSTVPRFCTNPSDVLEKVKLILTKKEPVGQGSKRPFIIAAKLIFLIPQKDNESTTDYIERLQRHLDKIC